MIPGIVAMGVILLVGMVLLTLSIFDRDPKSPPT